MNTHPLLVLGALLAACASAPPTTDQAELQLSVPADWTTDPTPTATFSTESANPDEEWWRGFADPDLDRLVEAALAGNRDLRAALARLEAAAQSRTIAAAGALPEVDAGLDAQRSRRLFLGFPFGGGTPSSTATTYGLSLSLRWELDLWGRVRASDSAAIADLQAAAADHAGARLSLVAQTCRAYFAAVEARQQLALAEATTASIRATADDVRDRYRRGVRPALDVHLAATNLANAEAAVAQRRDALQRALRQLDLLAGRYPRGDTSVAATLPSTLPPVPASLPSQLLQRRPDLVAAERRLAADGCRVDAAKAALYPRLSLTASGGTSTQQLEDLVDNDFRVWSLGANLLQPLFRGGALRADVARAQARRAEVLSNYGSAVLHAFVEVEDTLAATAQLDARRQTTTSAAHHASLASDLARQRYQLGLTDFLATADGQRQAYQADSARISIERLRLENRIDLFLAIGGGFAAPTAPTTP
jgi:outer membrane protein, multidrug efflux system